MMKLDSFKTGCILLSGLFLYDIWWVFGTKVVRQPIRMYLSRMERLTPARIADGQRCYEP